MTLSQKSRGVTSSTSQAPPSTRGKDSPSQRTSYRSKGPWDGISRYSPRGRQNLPITKGFLDKSTRLEDKSGGRAQGRREAKSTGNTGKKAFQPEHLPFSKTNMGSIWPGQVSPSNHGLISLLTLRILVNTAHQASPTNPSERTLPDRSTCPPCSKQCPEEFPLWPSGLKTQHCLPEATDSIPGTRLRIGCCPKLQRRSPVWLRSGMAVAMV